MQLKKISKVMSKISKGKKLTSYDRKLLNRYRDYILKS